MKLEDFQENKHVTKIADLGSIRGGTSTTTMSEGSPQEFMAETECTENEKWDDGRDAGTITVKCP